MAVTLQNPDLDHRLRALAAETGTSPEALAEETLTRYFAATAELGSILEERLREVEAGRVESVDGEAAFARLRELHARAGRGSIEKLQQVLSKVSDAPAEAIDQL